MDNEHLTLALKQLFAEELQCNIQDIAKENCYGCSVDHPSQLQHDICIMSTTDEWTDMFLEKAAKRINLKIIKEKWNLELKNIAFVSNSPNCDAGFVWNQISNRFKEFDTEDWSKLVKESFAES